MPILSHNIIAIMLNAIPIYTKAFLVDLIPSSPKIKPTIVIPKKMNQ
jgi:hypothetical protein